MGRGVRAGERCLAFETHLARGREYWAFMPQDQAVEDLHELNLKDDDNVRLNKISYVAS
jgi:hypothetical protein